jgi:hypothetical protein
MIVSTPEFAGNAVSDHYYSLEWPKKRAGCEIIWLIFSFIQVKDKVELQMGQRTYKTRQHAEVLLCTSPTYVIASSIFRTHKSAHSITGRIYAVPCQRKFTNCLPQKAMCISHLAFNRHDRRATPKLLRRLSKWLFPYDCSQTQGVCFIKATTL